MTLGSSNANTITVNGILQGAAPLQFNGGSGSLTTTLGVASPTGSFKVSIPAVTGNANFVTTADP